MTPEAEAVIVGMLRRGDAGVASLSTLAAVAVLEGTESGLGRVAADAGRGDLRGSGHRLVAVRGVVGVGGWVEVRGVRGVLAGVGAALLWGRDGPLALCMPPSADCALLAGRSRSLGAGTELLTAA